MSASQSGHCEAFAFLLPSILLARVTIFKEAPVCGAHGFGMIAVRRWWPVGVF